MSDGSSITTRYPSVIGEFISFLVLPKGERDRGYTVFNVIFRLLRLCIFELLCAVIFGFLTIKMLKTANILGFFRQSSQFFAPPLGVLVVGFLLPFKEEAMFRCALTGTRPAITLASIPITAFIAKSILRLFCSNQDISWVYELGAGCFCAFVVYVVMSNNRREKHIIQAMIQYRYLFYYISSLTFGLLHIANYGNIGWQALLLAPIITLPQIIGGLIAGFVRIRYGFFWSVAMHCMHNLAIVLGVNLLQAVNS